VAANEVLAALGGSVRQGLAGLLAELSRQADELREEVERDHYFKEGEINQHKRQDFERISERFLRRTKLDIGIG